MTKKKANPKPAGRKWFDGKDEAVVIAKLEEAAAIDATIDESVFYADISRDSYYRYLDAHPEIRNRLDSLRQRPVLLARQTVIKKLSESYQNAMDYLKRKKKVEFGDTTDITSGGEKLQTFDEQQLAKIAARILNGNTESEAASD